MGFETIVRPAVITNFRPGPTLPLAPADAPDQGLASISGGSGQMVTLNTSAHTGWSRSKHKETKRRVDRTRVYQKDDKGNVNKDNFIDVEVANKIWMTGSEETPYTYAAVKEEDNIEILEKNVIRKRTS